MFKGEGRVEIEHDIAVVKHFTPKYHSPEDGAGYDTEPEHR